MARLTLLLLLGLASLSLARVIRDPNSGQDGLGAASEDSSQVIRDQQGSLMRRRSRSTSAAELRLLIQSMSRARLALIERELNRMAPAGFHVALRVTVDKDGRLSLRPVLRPDAKPRRHG